MIHLPNDDNTCGWYDALGIVTAKPSLKDNISADYIIIGAGYGGLSIARQLAKLDPSARIILLEAQQVAQGAAGRNSGFVIDLPHKFSLEHPNPEHKRKILRLNRESISMLSELIDTHKINCQWSAAGKYQGAVGERGIQYLNHFEHLMKDLGEPYQVVEGENLKKVLGTDYYQRAIFTPNSYLVQPAALAKGLADSLPENVELFENSPAQGLTKENGYWTVNCDNASVKAKTLFLGTSIYTREFGYLKNRLLPVMTFASMTRPLTQQELLAYGGQLDWGLTPADHAGTTLRMTADKRIIIRNTYKHVPKYGASISKGTRDEIAMHHLSVLRSRYPQLNDVNFTHTWGGTYALSRNFTNFFGKLDEGVYANACDNGVGVAWGTISGRLLADLALEKESDLLTDIKEISGMPNLNPPEPFLGLGVRTRIKLARWHSRSEI